MRDHPLSVGRVQSAATLSLIFSGWRRLPSEAETDAAGHDALIRAEADAPIQH